MSGPLMQRCTQRVVCPHSVPPEQQIQAMAGISSPPIQDRGRARRGPRPHHWPWLRSPPQGDAKSMHPEGHAARVWVRSCRKLLPPMPGKHCPERSRPAGEIAHPEPAEAQVCQRISRSLVEVRDGVNWLDQTVEAKRLGRGWLRHLLSLPAIAAARGLAVVGGRLRPVSA